MRTNSSDAKLAPRAQLDMKQRHHRRATARLNNDNPLLLCSNCGRLDLCNQVVRTAFEPTHTRSNFRLAAAVHICAFFATIFFVFRITNVLEFMSSHLVFTEEEKKESKKLQEKAKARSPLRLGNLGQLPAVHIRTFFAAKFSFLELQSCWDLWAPIWVLLN